MAGSSDPNSESSAVRGHRFVAFISYRHSPEDMRWARWVQKAIETYRVPSRLAREAGLPRGLGIVFRDEDELPAAAHLPNVLDEALRDSAFLIVVCTPRTPQSAWVDREIRRFRE